MNIVVRAAIGMAIMSGLGLSQTTFEVTGTPVPSGLLKANYGALPRGIGAFTINICNLTEAKQTVVSSEVYRSLLTSNPELQPLGRQMVLSAILRAQGHRPLTILGTSLGSLAAALSVLGASRYALPGTWTSAIALASISTQQLLNAFKPVTTADQIEKFEAQVLGPSFLLDGGTCDQRTVFTVSSPKVKTNLLSFHVR